MIKRQPGILVVAVLAAMTISAVGCVQSADTPAEEGPFPRVVALVPEWRGFVGGADRWNFEASLVTASSEALEARFAEARAADQSAAGLEKNEWTAVVCLGEEFADCLHEYERLWRLSFEQRLRPNGDLDPRKKAEPLLEEIYGKLYVLHESGETEIEGITITIPPLSINPGETVVVELVFEVRKKRDPTKTWRITAPTSVSQLVLPPEGIPERTRR